MVKHNTDTNGIGYEWEYAKVKDDRTIWQKIVMGIYNPSSHEFLGRSAKSWGGILLFYVVFYSSLACMFGLCMQLFLSTLNDHTPNFILDDSLIGTNPGLGYRPVSANVEDGSLIYFSANNNSNVKVWTDKLEKFLDAYKNKTHLPGKGKENQQVCSYTLSPQSGKVCEVNVTENMGPCVASNHYGYRDGKPCVFIKLNKIFNWKPEYYNNETKHNDMPQNLKDKFSKYPPSEPELSTIWVSCDGETPADKENIGELVLHPREGFPGYYYPYKNIEGYLSPLVAIEFKNPKKHTLINVECRAWAQNIVYRRSLQNREGSVHFELMID